MPQTEAQKRRDRRRNLEKRYRAWNSFEGHVDEEMQRRHLQEEEEAGHRLGVQGYLRRGESEGLEAQDHSDPETLTSRTGSVAASEPSEQEEEKDVVTGRTRTTDEDEVTPFSEQSALSAANNDTVAQTVVGVDAEAVRADVDTKAASAGSSRVLKDKRTARSQAFKNAAPKDKGAAAAASSALGKSTPSVAPPQAKPTKEVGTQTSDGKEVKTSPPPPQVPAVSIAAMERDLANKTALIAEYEAKLLEADARRLSLDEKIYEDQLVSKGQLDELKSQLAAKTEEAGKLSTQVAALKHDFDSAAVSHVADVEVLKQEVFDLTHKSEVASDAAADFKKQSEEAKVHSAHLEQLAAEAAENLDILAKQKAEQDVTITDIEGKLAHLDLTSRLLDEERHLRSSAEAAHEELMTGLSNLMASGDSKSMDEVMSFFSDLKEMNEQMAAMLADAQAKVSTMETAEEKRAQLDFSGMLFTDIPPSPAPKLAVANTTTIIDVAPSVPELIPEPANVDVVVPTLAMSGIMAVELSPTSPVEVKKPELSVSGIIQLANIEPSSVEPLIPEVVQVDNVVLENNQFNWLFKLLLAVIAMMGFAIITQPYRAGGSHGIVEQFVLDTLRGVGSLVGSSVPSMPGAEAFETWLGLDCTLYG